MYKYDADKVSSELKEQLEGYGEATLYFHINTAGGVRHNVARSSAHQERPGAIAVVDAFTVEEEMFQEQRYCIEQLKTKGIVDNPVDVEGAPTDDYWTWFRAWKGYVRGLSSEEWSDFENALNSGGDISKWRPVSL